MAIWDFGDFETDDLERLVEMKEELTDMGLDLFGDEMMATVHMELSNREEDAEEEDEQPNVRPCCDDDQHTITHT
jgi:hypothetical protein